MRRRWIAIGLAVGAGLGAIAGATVPAAVAHRAAARLAVELGTPIRIGWLAWNPFTGTWTLDGVRVAAERGPAAVSARRVRARVSLGDILRGRWHVRSLAVDGARLRLRATPAGWEIPLPARDGDEHALLPTLEIDWAGAPRARVRLEGGPGVRSLLRLRQLELSGGFSPAGTAAIVWTRGRLDRGGVAFAGRIRSRASRRRIRLRLSATGLDLARILRLARVTAIRDLRGRIDLRARYDESGAAGQPVRRAAGSAHGHDVALGARGIEAVSVRALDITRFDVDLGRRALGFGPIRAVGAEFWLRDTRPLPLLPVLGEDTGGVIPGWAIALAGATLDGAVLHYVQGEPPRAIGVTLDQARLDRVADVTAPIGFSLAATLDTGGRVSASGQVVRRPAAVTARVRADDVVLPDIAAIAAVPVVLESGTLSGAGELSVREGALDGSGELTIADVKTASPDPAHPEDVLAAKEIRLGVHRARTSPPGVELDSLDVAWPYVLIDRSPERIFPLSLLAPGRAAPPIPASVRIDRASVVGARIDFRDTTLSPPYWRALANLRIDAVAIEAPSLRIADLAASGLVDELSPLRVHGTVGTRTRLVAEVERLALPPFNAYLAEGDAPYLVSSGLLSGRSEVVLERSELEVDNRVVLSRLGLAGGEGPDFVEREIGIPLTLALALMKDYRGNVELTLPFGGDLREPSFHLRSVVLQAIVGAIRGAVLSPLNALGRVILRDGRIESVELESIPFAPGARSLDPAGRERLAQIAHVMTSHLELAVRLRGTASRSDLEQFEEEAALSALTTAADAERLRAYLHARLSGLPPPALSDAERARLDALVAGLPFPADALHDLAVDRAAVAAAALILDHRVDPARVTPEPAAVLAPADLAAAPAATVELGEPQTGAAR